jgi:hypothetical protein
MTKPVLEWNTDDQIDNMDAWIEFTDDLTPLLCKIAKSTKWYCEVQNFGWMKRNGYKSFVASTGAKFLHQILPQTECNFKIFVEGTGFGRKIKIQNWHHDSNDGSEWYIVRPWKKGDPDPK